MSYGSKRIFAARQIVQPKMPYPLSNFKLVLQTHRWEKKTPEDTKLEFSIGDRLILVIGPFQLYSNIVTEVRHEHLDLTI